MGFIVRIDGICVASFTPPDPADPAPFLKQYPARLSYSSIIYKRVPGSGRQRLSYVLDSFL